MCKRAPPDTSKDDLKQLCKSIRPGRARFEAPSAPVTEPLVETTAAPVADGGGVDPSTSVPGYSVSDAEVVVAGQHERALKAVTCDPITGAVVSTSGAAASAVSTASQHTAVTGAVSTAHVQKIVANPAAASAVSMAQIAEATHKGVAQEVDVPSSAVLEAYAHDLPLPMSSYLMSQQHEVSCGGYPFPDPYGWFAPMTVTSRCPISIPYLNYPMIKGPDIPICLSSSAVLQAYLKVQSSA